MAPLRLALNQIDATVGDLEGNAESVVQWTRHAVEQGAHLVAFPEMMLTGYPVEDLALRASFVEASRAGLLTLARRLADEGLGETPVVVGYLDRSAEVADTEYRYGQPVGAPQNAAAVLHRGEPVLTFAKHHLPNYGVFDEYRYFVPGETLPIVRVHGIDVALAICEDLWQEGGRVPATRQAGAGLLLSLNASPYERDKDDARLELVRKRAQEAGCTTAYLAMIGGQDELVFDGDSLVCDRDGEVLARAPQFEQGCVVLDLDLPTAPTEPPSGTVDDGMRIVHHTLSAEPLPAREPGSHTVVGSQAPRLVPEEEIYTALVVGLRAYVAKNGFRSVLLGLSGGIDSALTAAIACDAVGPEQVHALSMPSRYSSEHSQTDAAELAHRTGLHYRSVPIGPMFDSYMGELGLTGTAEENLQARLRGTTLMAVSNQEGHIVLAPGNKSELAVGYSTLYGDAVGAYGPIKDVYKTTVFQLARWRNQQAAAHGQTPPIPENTLSKPPSAELRPGQVDTDSLPDYGVLDRILELYVDQDQDRSEIVARGFEREVVERVLGMTDASEYKRRQYPPGTKISPKGFGKDRRMPITNRWRGAGSSRG